MNIQKNFRDMFWMTLVVGMFSAGWFFLGVAPLNSGRALFQWIVLGLSCSIGGGILAWQKGAVCQLIDHKHVQPKDWPTFDTFTVKVCKRCGDCKVENKHG